MITPLLKDEALLADIASVNHADEHVRLWWLGQSGFLVQWQGRHLLLDPYLSDSLTAKYADTDKPHVRMTERCVDPAALDFIDVVTSSHNHTDHLDADTLAPLLLANADIALVVPAANVAFAADRVGVAPDRLVGLQIGEATEVGPFRLEAVPAAHESLDPHFAGYVVKCGPWTLYHSGDTVLYPGMVERLRPHRVDVAMLPINGRAPERRVAGNLSAVEAAQLGRSIGARTIIPCHYDMFTFNTGDPADFIAACAAVGQRSDVLRCGEQWTSAALGERGAS